MKKSPLSGLVIRSGAVRLPDVGYLLACNPKQEKKDISHTVSFTVKSGKFNKGSAKYSAHSCCLIESPESGLVKISAPGIYSVSTGAGLTIGNIFNDSHPRPTKPRYGDIRSVSSIDQKAYAVGFGGAVYRLDALMTWNRLDEGLPGDVNLQAVHGFSASDIYVVGMAGTVFRFDGKEWKRCNAPSDNHLTCVECCPDGNVYIGGHDGILIRGVHDSWKIITHKKITDDIWNLKWFHKNLYVSTLRNLYCLEGAQLIEVDFGRDRPSTFYHLSATDEVMWSIGERDVMQFDGKTWTRIV